MAHEDEDGELQPLISLGSSGLKAFGGVIDEEFLRNLPTGANPNAISFGNFSGGGTVLNMRPRAA